MKKLNIILLVLLLIVPTVMAGLSYDDIRFIGEQNQPLDIKEQCFNNNSYCSSAAGCNVTITNPKQTIIINNQLMTNQIAFHNYTINGSSTSEMDVYETTVTCKDNGYNGYEVFFFEILPNGFVGKPESITGVGIIMMGLLIVFIVLSRVLSDNHYVLKTMFTWFVFIIIMPLLWMARLMGENYSAKLGNAVGSIFYTYSIIFVFISFYIIINIIRYVLQYINMKKEMKENDII